MSTPLTNDKADEIIVALNAVTAELKECLKTAGGGPAGGGPAAPVVASVAPATVGGVSASPITTTTTLKSATEHTTNVKFIVEYEDDTYAKQKTVKIVSFPTTSAPYTVAANSLFYDFQFKKDSGDYLLEPTSTPTTFEYYKDGLFSNDASHSKLSATMDFAKYIDSFLVFLNKQTNVNDYFAVPYAKFDADGKQNDAGAIEIADVEMVFDDSTVDITIYKQVIAGTDVSIMGFDASVTIDTINVSLKAITLKGGRRRRQTRRGGKRYRRKSRRFR